MRRKGKSKEDAEDLVQGFFAHLIQCDGLLGMDQQKGRFRAFLLASLNHWMINDWKRGARQKRGGGAVHLSFDWKNAEDGVTLEIADEDYSARLYDREWALTLLNKVMEDLEAAARAESKIAQFKKMKSCLTLDSGVIPYAEIAAELEMSEGAVRVAVHRLRKRYRHLLTLEISRTLSTDDAVEEEMRSLFLALVD